MGGLGDANDVGNDGLTHTQRQVKSVLDSERHRENPDGLTADQVCTGLVMLSVCYTRAHLPIPPWLSGQTLLKSPPILSAQKFVRSHCCKADLSI